MKVLVAGADRVDAGKTTFATGLLARLGGVGVKPRAGNDFWFDHDDYRAAVEAGRMYGKDAARLAAASEEAPEPEAINPIHRLWRPAPDGDAFIGPADRAFVLDRIGDRYVVNANVAVPMSAADALPLADATRVSTIQELNTALERLVPPVYRALTDRLRSTDPVVIESYSDIARPITPIEVDRVAVVEPGRVRVYDGSRYEDACEVTSGRPTGGQLEEPVEDVIALLEPVAVASLPPLTEPDRGEPDRVADAYAPAYEVLLDG